MQPHIATIAVALFLAVLIAVPFAAGGEGDATEYKVGNMRIWAIADSRGDRDMTVFKDADPALVAKYAPTGKSPSAIMTFVVRTGDKTLLVDTGLGNPSGPRASALMAGLAKAGIDAAAIDAVLVTHMHGDHIGGLLDPAGGRAFPKAAVHIGAVEHGFWLAPESLERFPTRAANFELARKVADAYAGAVETFAFGETPFPGVTAVDAVGHTPGHTAFMLESTGERLLIVGDILHAAALQFPHPEINATYDMIPGKAAATRRALLRRSAEEKLPIAGMHIPFPGIGTAEAEGDGFLFRPIAEAE